MRGEVSTLTCYSGGGSLSPSRQRAFEGPPARTLSPFTDVIVDSSMRKGSCLLGTVS